MEIDEPARPFAADPFGQTFRKMRMEMQVSIATFSEEVGLTPVEISEVERGVVGLSTDAKDAWWQMLERCVGTDLP